MATTLADLKTRLNTWLRDSQDLTFTSAEKDELLAEAINDPYVYGITRDTSITLLTSVYSYAVPSGISGVFSLEIDMEGLGISTPVDVTLWEEINGTIYLHDASLPAGKTLVVIGRNKHTTSTSDFPAKVQEYILHLAMVGAFEMLKTSLTTRFVKNDMTMSDLLQSIATHQRRADLLRRSLANQRVVAV